MRARLQTRPVMIPTWGWPDHNDPGEAVRPRKLEPAQPGACRPTGAGGSGRCSTAAPTPERAGAIRPLALDDAARSTPTCADRATVLEGYQAVAARHQRALEPAAQRAADPVPRQRRPGALRDPRGRASSTRCTRSTRPSPIPTSRPREPPKPSAFLVQRGARSGRRTEPARAAAGRRRSRSRRRGRVMAERDFLQSLAGEALDFFAFVGEALGSDGARRRARSAISAAIRRPPAPPRRSRTSQLDQRQAPTATAADPSAEAGAQALRRHRAC